MNNNNKFILLIILLSMELIFSYKLDCEKQSFKDKYYLPSLLTFSRKGLGKYEVNLRCQGKTLYGNSIHNDVIDVKIDVVNSTFDGDETSDRHFARFVTLSCGQSCFNPLITEYDLLTGRVCLENKGKLSTCRGTSIYVDEKNSYQNNNSRVWKKVSIAIIVINIIAIVGLIVFRYKGKCKRNQQEDNLKDISVTKNHKNPEEST